jgi:hypothetical protein
MPKGLRPITTYDVFNGSKECGEGATVASDAIDLREVAQNGVFSIEYLITGDGTATIAFTVCSTKSGTYFTPTGASAIVTGLTKNSGSGGHGGLGFPAGSSGLPIYPFMKITITETANSTNHVFAKILLNVQ